MCGRVQDNKIAKTNTIIVDDFLLYIAKNRKLFWPAIQKNINNRKELFYELAVPMLEWSRNYLGERYDKILTEGYVYFVTDVNRSQMGYEKLGHYKNKTYTEVCKSQYSNEDHMSKYHWGVYVTTFAWEHHLKIYKFFNDNFLANLDVAGGTILEFGAGSGIWGMLVMNKLQNWNVIGVDISPFSVNIAKEMAKCNGFGKRSMYIADNALTFKNQTEVDVAISCFLLEHLETPQLLLSNMARNLKIGGYAFITCALTAAESDHIFEFKHESEIILMAEQAGFRVISTFSSAPESYPSDYRFLPRSMALLLQKKKNNIW